MTSYMVQDLYEGRVDFTGFMLTCAKHLAPHNSDSMYDTYSLGRDVALHHLTRYREELAEVESWSDETAEAEAGQEYAERSAEVQRQHDWTFHRLSRLLEMLGHVDDWTPPTTAHQPLKDFMRRQLTGSLATCTFAPPAERLSGQRYKERRLAVLRRQVAEQEADVAKLTNDEAHEQHRRWLEQLRASLPAPA